ncbi:nucleotidyltransferase family protein [Thermodesulfobacteriota bacterium]
MMYLTNEEKIIFLAFRLNPSAGDIKAIERLVSGNSKTDYKKLIHLATLNGVASLLYKNLKEIDAVPDDVLSKLRKVYLHSIVHNLKQTRELLKILQILKDNGIEAIPLKGALASEIIFENPGLYVGSDIDILVRPSDLQQTKQILINSGYSYDEEPEKAMLSSHYHLVFYNNEHTVEVHWNLVKRYFDISPEFWWEDTFIEPYGEQQILCLAPEKYLMYTIFRLFSHMFHPLKFFVLISETSNKYYKRIDWAQFELSIKEL